MTRDELRAKCEALAPAGDAVAKAVVELLGYAASLAADNDRLRAALGMIGQIVHGSTRVTMRIALDALAGAELRDLDTVEASAEGTWAQLKARVVELERVNHNLVGMVQSIGDGLAQRIEQLARTADEYDREADGESLHGSGLLYGRAEGIREAIRLLSPCPTCKGGSNEYYNTPGAERDAPCPDCKGTGAAVKGMH